VQIGDVLRSEVAFTDADVEAFTTLSQDTGRHHVVRDEAGRLVVHGLLVATLATRIGGSLDFIARTMVFEFVRPVFTGDLIRCAATVIAFEPEAMRDRVELVFACTNEVGKEVMRGSTSGIIRHAPR